MNLDLAKITTNKGNDLKSLSHDNALLVIFLRHFGCIFCQEALSDISTKKDILKARNTKVVFVHMASEEEAEKYFQDYNLDFVEHISNPNCSLYASFGLSKGSFGQLFGLQTWKRGFDLKKAGMKFSTKQVGDSFQMPGIFLICNGNIKESYIHKKVSDKPDYEKMINCCAAIA